MVVLPCVLAICCLCWLFDSGCFVLLLAHAGCLCINLGGIGWRVLAGFAWVCVV